MLKRIKAFSRLLASDERGLGLIEMAAMAPFLALLIAGVVDVTRGITERMKLHYAVHRTIELAASHDLVMGNDDSEFDFTYLKQQAASVAGVAPSAVTVTVWLECDGVEQPDFKGSCNSTQTSARYLQISVDSSYKPIFGFGPIGGSGQNFALHAEAAVRIQ